MIEPDTKDWTWVLREPCPECGFVAADMDRRRFGDAIRADAMGWPPILALPDAARRPDESTWSPLEYACHVRDVHRIFAERLRLMLEEDEPRFANWDQDEAAVADRYDLQDPAVVGEELVAAASAVAQQYDAVPGDAWGRRGLRSNGSEFTVESIGRYHLHDIVHHAHDVRRLADGATRAAYDRDAASYRDGTIELPDTVREALDAFAAAVGAGGRVLEIGSGPGRDARELEARGVSVRRTDVTPAFVELMRAEGHPADVLDPLTDDLADPERPGLPYDGVWANACLLHVNRDDLPVLLRRVGEATRPGGPIAVSVKEGDGEGWVQHGHVSAPRHFVYWREGPLRELLEGAGWQVLAVRRQEGLRGEHWLELSAVRG
jgi:SAM-dependent methyltransferase